MIPDKSTSGNGKKFKRLEPGYVAARLYSIIDLGIHEEEFNGESKHRRKVQLSFETDQPMDDGRPLVISTKKMTFSYHESAALTKFLSQWLGSRFSPNLDMVELEHEPAYLQLDYARRPNGEIVTNRYGDKIVNIVNCLPLPQGIEAPPAVNEWRVFDTNAPDMDMYMKFPDWLRKRINLKHPASSVPDKVEPQAKAPMPDFGRMIEEAQSIADVVEVQSLMARSSVPDGMAAALDAAVKDKITKLNEAGADGVPF